MRRAGLFAVFVALVTLATGAGGTVPLHLSGSTAELRLGGVELSGVTFEVDAPDARRPQLATVRLRARTARMGDQRWRRVAVDLTNRRDGRLVARVDIAGQQPLKVEAEGRWSEGFTLLTLSRLVVVYPEARWTLERPARIHISPGRLAVEDLALGSGAQRVTVKLEKKGAKIDGRIELVQLLIDRLPTLARPARFPAGGQIDALVALASGRLVGQMTVRVAGATARARFDLPAAWPPPPTAPASLALTLEPVAIAEVLEQIGRGDIPAAGQVALDAQLSGTAGNPTVKVTAEVRQLTVRGQAVGDIDVHLDAVPRGPLVVTAEGRPFGAPARLEARAPLSIRDLMRGQVKLAALPFEVTMLAPRVPLATVARLLGRDDLRDGVLSIEGSASGPATQPSGRLDVRVQGAAGPGFPPTDARVELSAGKGVRGAVFRMEVARQGRMLATATGRLRSATTDLVRTEAVASAPLELTAHIGPLHFQRRGPAGLTGDITADLRVEGSLRSPRVSILGTASALRFGARPLGQAQARFEYRDRRLKLDSSLDEGGRRVLRVRASTELDLSYPTFGRGAHVQDMPLAMHIESHQVDLRPLSNLTDQLGEVGGTVDADLTVAGRIGAPTGRGRLEWKEGRLAVRGFGHYEQIHLALRGDEQSIVLEELTARSGDGMAKVTAHTKRVGKDRALGGRVELTRWPLYAGGQPTATISLLANADGTVTDERARVVVRLPEAHVALLAGKRKKLQPLDRPGDIVLLKNGRRLRTKKAGSSRARAPIPIRIEIEAPRNLWVKGPDVQMELGLDSGFVASYSDELLLFGRVVVRRGRAEVVGRNFDIVPGSAVRFAGPPAASELAVKGVFDARQADSTVEVSIDGPVTDPQLALRSPEHPEFGDTELLTLVATGRLPDDRAGTVATPSSHAASLVGRVITSQVQKALSTKLPLDILSIEPGEGLGMTRLEAGTYLTDEVYVAYVGRVGEDPFRRQNRNEVQLEYQLSRRWSFEATYGDARRGSADLVWTKRY